jgi:hypothetical protein
LAREIKVRDLIKKGADMNRKFEHNQIVTINDTASPHYGRRGEIWVISQDTVKARNPENKVRYTITFIDGGEETELFYQDQLASS